MFLSVWILNFASAIFAQDLLSLQEVLTAHKNSSAKFLPLPLIRQSKSYTCGASALQSLMHYYGDEMREGQLVRLLKTNKEDGTPYGNILMLLNKLNSSDTLAREKILATPSLDEQPEPPAQALALDTKSTWKKYQINLWEGRTSTFRNEIDIDDKPIPLDGMSSKDLQASIDASRPVLVMFQAHGGPVKTVTEDDGHFALIIGYDSHNFYFMDPSTTGNYAFMPKLEFVKNWHDTSNELLNGKKQTVRVNHFGLIIFKDEAQFDFDHIHRIH